MVTVLNCSMNLYHKVSVDVDQGGKVIVKLEQNTENTFSSNSWGFSYLFKPISITHCLLHNA